MIGAITLLILVGVYLIIKYLIKDEWNKTKG